MKKNRKAFTLIELLGIISLLGLIMTMAVPNTIKMLERNKKNKFIEDGFNFLSQAKIELLKDPSIKKPTNDSEITVINLNYLSNNDLNKTPMGDLYNKAQSYVAIVLPKTGIYEYFVTLVSCGNTNESEASNICKEGSTVNGIDNLSFKELEATDSYKRVQVGIGILSAYLTQAKDSKGHYTGTATVTPALINTINEKADTNIDSSVASFTSGIDNEGPIKVYIK